MNAENIEAVLDLMVATWHVGKPSTAAELDVWRDVLSPLSFIIAEDAVRNVLATESQFFPTVKDFRQAYRDHERRMAQTERQARTRCPECDDNPSAMVTVSPPDTIPPTVRPCSRCAPVQYQLWIAGHRRTDHSCSICKDIRSHNQSVRDRAEEKLMEGYRPYDLDATAEQPF